LVEVHTSFNSVEPLAPPTIYMTSFLSMTVLPQKVRALQAAELWIRVNVIPSVDEYTSL
jgi:hypothetical protein